MLLMCFRVLSGVWFGLYLFVLCWILLDLLFVYVSPSLQVWLFCGFGVLCLPCGLVFRLLVD